MKRINENPRISVNPLCEYISVATASRRYAIIKQCKIPPTYITKWYNKAEACLANYLSDDRDQPFVLEMDAYRLRSTVAVDEMEKKYQMASANALLSFLCSELSVRKTLEPFKPEVAVHDPNHKFMLNGVQISLRPELILRDGKGKQQLGFVKFYFGKDEPLDKVRGELMACLTKYYFETEFGFSFKTDHCMVLDVYRGVIYTAPKAHLRNLANIKAACKEIADRWDRVEV